VRANHGGTSSQASLKGYYVNGWYTADVHILLQTDGLPGVHGLIVPSSTVANGGVLGSSAGRFGEYLGL